MGERWLVFKYREATLFAAVHVPSSFIFLLRPVWKEGGPMGGEPEGTAGQEGMESACEEDTLTRE